jgi:DNA-binding XRE family transcriptional regulator
MSTLTVNKPTSNELRQASKRSREVIAGWLRDTRIKADLSQEGLANLAGIDRKTVNRIENGHFSPSVDTMTRIALVLGKKIPQLV